MTELAGNSSDRARTRLEAIEPLLALLEIPASERFPHLFPDGQRAESWSDAVDWCAARSKCSRRTIQRIHALYQRWGKDGLSQKPRRDKGLSRFFSHAPKAAAFAAYLHLTWKLNPTQILSALRSYPSMFRATPSAETIRLFVKITPMPALIKLALEGQLAYRRVASECSKRGLFTHGTSVGRKIA